MILCLSFVRGMARPVLRTDVSPTLAIGAVTLYLKQIGRLQEAKAFDIAVGVGDEDLLRTCGERRSCHGERVDVDELCGGGFSADRYSGAGLKAAATDGENCAACGCR